MLRALFLAASLSVAAACTTLIAGKDATTDGSVMVSHSNDGEFNTDPRLVHIPARDYDLSNPAERLRPIYAAPESYPRYVCSKGPHCPKAYESKGPLQVPFKPIGFIDQVEHTFSYHEETYASVNEHQVAIGESTCSGVFATNSTEAGGFAIMSIDQLSRIALERSTSSRAAVKLMGSLAEKFGFYGANSFEGSAESLLVIDPEEGFIFHVLPDPTGRSAIWVAQRVPDDHVAVVANMFTIREVDLKDSRNFLGSANMHAVAEAHGWWSPASGKKLDFTATFSDGEYAHKYYTGRRMWGAYRLLAPETFLPSEYGDLRRDAVYPTTTAVAAPVSLQDFFAVHRYHYQGTRFDMTKGMASGAFGTPDRYTKSVADSEVKGNWERPIGLFRTSDSYVVQARSWLPREVGATLWWGAHAAHGTVYAPYPAGMDALPEATKGVQADFDRSTAFWAHRYVLNLAQIKYVDMIREVQDRQRELEERGLEIQRAVDERWLASGGGDRKELTRVFSDHAADIVRTFVRLSDELMFKYADGWNNYDTHAVPVIPHRDTPAPSPAPPSDFDSRDLGYPDWWIKNREVGYVDGPPSVPTTRGQWLNRYVCSAGRCRGGQEKPAAGGRGSTPLLVQYVGEVGPS
jgi:dipeptidase